jgi:hypothetical protein
MAGDDRWEHMQVARSGGANGRRQWGRVDWAPATATATLRYPVVICQPSERSVAFPQREEPRGQQQQQQQHQAWRQPCLKRRCGNYCRCSAGPWAGSQTGAGSARRRRPYACCRTVEMVEESPAASGRVMLHTAAAVAAVAAVCNMTSHEEQVGPARWPLQMMQMMQIPSAARA